MTLAIVDPQSTNRQAIDPHNLTFEITNLGRAALAWEEPELPRVGSQKTKGGNPVVTASLGADIEIPERIVREKGIEVVISGATPEGVLYIGLAWALGGFLGEVEGPMAVEQLDQLITTLTAARDEAERIGALSGALYQEVEQSGSSPDEGQSDLDDGERSEEASDDVAEVCRACGVLFHPISNTTQRCNDCGG
jgi:hypothetical protein